MDSRYHLRHIPEDGPLKCDLCGSDVLGEDALSGSRATPETQLMVVESALRNHLQHEHGEMFVATPSIIIGEERESTGTFPDEVARPLDDEKKAVVPPPRSPDETT